MTSADGTAERPAPRPDLRPLLSPRSIAVIGASQRGGRATGAVKNLLGLGFTGGIYPVNPKYSTVLDLPCYPDLAAIPGPVDLVVIGIPAEQVPETLRLAQAKGVGAAVIFASGYGEAGAEGLARQAELEAFARETGMLICGPNCLGVIDLHGRGAGYSSSPPQDVAVGDVAVVSQSGTVIVALVGSRRGIGFSHLVSCGNEAALAAADYLRYLADDPKTRVLAAFLEGIRKPQVFVAAAKAARAAGKPLILVKTGRSEEGGRASAAHTGSLAGSHAVHQALFRQLGAVACDDLDEWLEAIELFRYAKPPHGPGVGIIGVSGGQNALVLDHAAALGLSVPPLAPASRAALAAALPWFARPENPIDPTGAAITEAGLYQKCLEILAADPGIGLIAVSQDSPSWFDLTAAKAVAEAAARSSKPFVFFSNVSGAYKPEVQAVLHEAKVPFLLGIRESLKAIKALIDYHAARPEAAARTPALDDGRRARALALLEGPGETVTEDRAKALLALYGLPVVRERVVRSAAEAAAAAEALGYPVALKLLSADVPHKAAIGGVALDLASAEAVRAAAGRIKAAVATAAPQARVEGLVVQPMIGAGVEVILGIKRDPEFGATILFGLGGVLVELLKQYALRLAPLTVADARAMIEEVPAGLAILKKSLPDVDPVTLLTPYLLALSDLALELGAAIEAIDVNPLIIERSTGRAQIVDALIIRGSRE